MLTEFPAGEHQVLANLFFRFKYGKVFFDTLKMPQLSLGIF